MRTPQLQLETKLAYAQHVELRVIKMGNQGRVEIKARRGLTKAARHLAISNLLHRFLRSFASLRWSRRFRLFLSRSWAGQHPYPGLLIALSTLLLVVGCVSTPKKIMHYYSHPEHGLVMLPNDHYAEAQLQCKTQVYQKGVLVDRQQTFDMARIDAYLKEANVWYIKKMYEIKSVKRAAAIGHAAGMHSAGIKVPVMLPSDYGTESPEMPEKYHDVLRASQDVRQCLEESGWIREKSEVVK